MKTGGAVVLMLALAAAGIGGGLWLHQRQAQQQAIDALTAPRTASTVPRTASSGPTTASSAGLFASTLDDLQHHSVALGAWRGQTLVVNFWASWCPPCVAEMPELSAFYQQHQRNNFKMVGIALDNPDAVRAFLAQHAVAYPVLLGGTRGDALSKQLGDDIDALPYTVVIDAQGRVVWRHAGRVDIQELAAQLR